MKLGIVACDILRPEIEFLTKDDPDFVVREYLEFALHEYPQMMRERIIESAKAQAQAEADKILQNAKNEIRAEKQSALRDLSALVSSLSVQVAEKIVRHKLETDPQEQIKLIDGLIEEASRLNDSAGVQRKA